MQDSAARLHSDIAANSTIDKSALGKGFLDFQADLSFALWISTRIRRM
jgi:hypothetical protein